MISLQYLEVVFSFLSLTELTRFFYLSFVLWSFQVLGKDLMDYGTRSGKSLSLGMPKAPQGKIQGQPKSLSLGIPRKASPISSSSIGNFTWSYIFYSPRDMCFAWSVLYDLSLWFLVCHNNPCCTHLLRRTHMNHEFIGIFYVLHLYLLS